MLRDAGSSEYEGVGISFIILYIRFNETVFFVFRDTEAMIPQKRAPPRVGISKDCGTRVKLLVRAVLIEPPIID